MDNNEGNEGATESRCLTCLLRTLAREMEVDPDLVVKVNQHHHVLILDMLVKYRAQVLIRRPDFRSGHRARVVEAKSHTLRATTATYSQTISSQDMGHLDLMIDQVSGKWERQVVVPHLREDFPASFPREKLYLAHKWSTAVALSGRRVSRKNLINVSMSLVVVEVLMWTGRTSA
jgi:hypothetical protein